MFQAIRRSPYNWSHGCSVTSALRLRGLFLGLSGQGVRSRGLGAFCHGGGSRGAPAVGGFAASTSTSGTIISGRRATKQASQGDCWPVVCASYEGWRFLEADKCATFPLWTFGTILPGCSGATRCQTDVSSSPRNSVNTAPDLQASERCRRHFGACGGWVPQDGSGPLGRGSQAFGGGPRGAPPAALTWGSPRFSSTARTSSSRDSCGSWRRWGSTIATRRATLGQIRSWAGVDASASSGSHWERAASRTKCASSNTLAT